MKRFGYLFLTILILLVPSNAKAEVHEHEHEELLVTTASVDFSGGLLDGQPFEVKTFDKFLLYTYLITDNNLTTYYRLVSQYLMYTFQYPVNITGYRIYTNSSSRTGITFYLADGTSVYTSRPKVNGDFIELNLPNVTGIKIARATQDANLDVYEFNVYGTISIPLPSRVQGVKVRDITATSALISWDANPESEGVLKYIVYLNDEKYGETTNAEYTLNNLQPSTTYTVRIEAINVYGAGPQSDLVEFTTLEIPPDPATQVRNIAIKNMTSTSALISWTPNPETERITKYIIYVNGEKYGETENTEYLIEGLKEGERYTVTVAAVNALGEGPPSIPIKFTPYKIADISSTIKIQDVWSAIAVLFTNLWPLIAFILAVIAIVPITTALKQTITRRRSDA